VICPTLGWDATPTRRTGATHSHETSLLRVARVVCLLLFSPRMDAVQPPDRRGGRAVLPGCLVVLLLSGPAAARSNATVMVAVDSVDAISGLDESPDRLGHVDTSTL